MVQVDVFWAYGLGASLALASGRQLAGQPTPFATLYFVKTLLFLSLCWAPTGMLLLLWHPSWETMQAADNLASLPALLILAFGVTNITQGILGFWVGLKLMQRGRYYLANLNWLLGYFGMFFILVYGWDGLGWDRFFYDRDMLPGSPAWRPGAGVAGLHDIGGILAAIGQFATSSVARTLYLDGVYLIPPFALLLLNWLTEGQRRQPGASPALPGKMTLLTRYLAGVFVLALGSAIVSALIVNQIGGWLGVGDHVARALGRIPAQTPAHIASYLLGLPLSAAILWWAAFKPGRFAERLLQPLHLQHSGPEPTAAKLASAD